MPAGRVPVMGVSSLPSALLPFCAATGASLTGDHHDVEGLDLALVPVLVHDLVLERHLAVEIIGRLIGEAAVLSIEGQASKRFLVHELIGQCAAVGIGALRNRTGDRRVLGARRLAGEPSGSSSTAVRTIRKLWMSLSPPFPSFTRYWKVKVPLAFAGGTKVKVPSSLKSDPPAIRPARRSARRRPHPCRPEGCR